MKVKIINEIKYFNEAMIVASKTFNYNAEDDKPIIDYTKLSVSKEYIDENFKGLEDYFESVRLKSISIANDYKEFEELFLINKSNISLANLFIFGNLKKSIRDYKKEELSNLMREAFVDHLNSMVGDELKYEGEDTIKIVDSLYILENGQKYILLKLIDNVSDFFDRFIEFISKLEDMIKEEFSKIESIYNLFLKKISYEDIKNMDIIKKFEVNKIHKNIKIYEIYLFLNFSFDDLGLSVVSEDNDVRNLKAIIFLGFIKYVLKEFNLNLEEKKDDIQKKLSEISDFTRFNILYSLSKERSFGKELSEKLDVSKGTMSYHLNSLVSQNLINIEMEGKKIYYSINKKGFEEVIDFLKSMIGEKDE